jgi:hypothetical protein
MDDEGRSPPILIKSKPCPSNLDPYRKKMNAFGSYLDTYYCPDIDEIEIYGQD